MVKLTIISLLILLIASCTFNKVNRTDIHQNTVKYLSSEKATLTDYDEWESLLNSSNLSNIVFTYVKENPDDVSGWRSIKTLYDGMDGEYAYKQDQFMSEYQKNTQIIHSCKLPIIIELAKEIKRNKP